MSKVQIIKDKFIQQVNEERMSAKELSDYYGLSVMQIKKAAKSLNLTFKRKVEDKFEFVEEVQVLDDNIDNTQEIETVDEQLPF